MLENLSYVEFNCLNELPEVSAIYFVKKEDDFLYVGKTNNLAHRWLTHHRFAEFVAMKADRIEWLVVEDLTTLETLEDNFIKTLRPMLNGCRIKTKNNKKVKLINTEVNSDNTEIAEDCENEPSRVRFQVYLCQEDADTLKWISQHFKPESESSLIKRCLLSNSSLGSLVEEIMERKKVRDYFKNPG